MGAKLHPLASDSARESAMVSETKEKTNIPVAPDGRTIGHADEK
jgi:hypothetical protein